MLVQTLSLIRTRGLTPLLHGGHFHLLHLPALVSLLVLISGGGIFKVAVMTRPLHFFGITYCPGAVNGLHLQRTLLPELEGIVPVESSKDLVKILVGFAPVLMTLCSHLDSYSDLIELGIAIGSPWAIARNV